MSASKLSFTLRPFLLFAALMLPLGVQAENAKAPHPSMIEDKDGEITAGEYIVVSPNGSITRSVCPYTCEMRGLPQEHCKSWPSKRDPKECYIQDTRLPSNAIDDTNAHQPPSQQ